MAHFIAFILSAQLTYDEIQKSKKIPCPSRAEYIESKNIFEDGIRQLRLKDYKSAIETLKNGIEILGESYKDYGSLAYMDST